MGKHKPPKPQPSVTSVNFGDMHTIKGRWLPDGTIQGSTFDMTIGDAQVCGTGIIIDDNGIQHVGTFFRFTISSAEICVPDGFFFPSTSQPYDPFPPVSKRIGDAMTVTTPAVQLSQRYDKTLTNIVNDNLGDCIVVGHDYLPAGHFQDPAYEFWLVRRTIGDTEWAVKVNA